MKSSNDVLDKKAQQELEQIARNMRAELKQLSKNQLIRIIFEQVNLNMEQRAANAQLLEQLKSKGES